MKEKALGHSFNRKSPKNDHIFCSLRKGKLITKNCFSKFLYIVGMFFEIGTLIF